MVNPYSLEITQSSIGVDDSMESTTANEHSVRTWMLNVLNRLAVVQPNEVRPLLWSFTYFFAILCAYYIVRPLRDEMGIAGGVNQLQWMFSGTFMVMLLAVPLFGWITRRYPPRKFLPYVYAFFIFALLLFYVLFASDVTHAYIARTFFIWASVFNLFIVSVFWSFMVDTFSSAQAKRLFGAIAAGGTVGAIAGPIITATLAMLIGPTHLLLVSMLFLGLALVCLKQLILWRRDVERHASDAASSTANSTPDQIIGGSVLAGIRLVLSSPYLLGICLMMVLFTTLSTFLYFQQAHIISLHISAPAQRTALFAAMDFSVNTLTLGIQLLLTGRIVHKFGIAWTLALIPLLLGAGFLYLGIAPVLIAVVLVQVIRRAGNYAINRPAREMLYVILGREEKYKAKNVIDTVVYRGGDAVSAWVYAGLQAMGFSISAIAFLAVPLAGIWAGISFHLGRMHDRKVHSREKQPHPFEVRDNLQNEIKHTTTRR